MNRPTPTLNSVSPGRTQQRYEGQRNEPEPPETGHWNPGRNPLWREGVAPVAPPGQRVWHPRNGGGTSRFRHPLAVPSARGWRTTSLTTLAARVVNQRYRRSKPIPPGGAANSARGAANSAPPGGIALPGGGQGGGHPARHPPAPSPGTHGTRRSEGWAPPARPGGRKEAPAGQKRGRGEAPGNGPSSSAHRARRSTADSGSVAETHRAS